MFPQLKKVESTSKEGNGAIGIDLNADHVACVETDRFGNPIRTQFFPGFRMEINDQLKALTGDLCKKYWLGKRDKQARRDRRLDFKKKKFTLKEEGNKKFSRLLSSFAYGLFFEFLIARAYKEGVTSTESILHLPQS